MTAVSVFTAHCSVLLEGGAFTGPAYAIARKAAERIHAHFQPQLPPGLSDVAAMESIIDAAFWASLRREEGYMPRISLALVGPDSVQHPLTFERRLPLAAHPLTRLSPAVERPGIHLGVCRENGDLFVWGATRNLPPFCFVLEVISPGVLVVKHSRGDQSGKFVNIAVIQGDDIKVIDQQSALLPDCPDLLTSLLGFDTQHHSTESVNVLIQLAVSMRAHGRGGSLLVVPPEDPTWRDSVVQPILYALDPPFSVLKELMDQRDMDQSDGLWTDSLRRAIDGIAGLTAVDGATVITQPYEVLAFGAKIVRRRGSPQISQVVVTEPVEGARPEVVEPAQLGGTRHLSAAQFVHDQRDAVALIASQDGGFTVFAWSGCEGMVHAHRIETLLL